VLVDDDASMQDLSKERENQFIENLQAHCNMKKSGAHSSNMAAAMDCQACITRVSTEICTVKHLLDGTKVFSAQKSIGADWDVYLHVFFMCAHIRDNMVPSWADSDDAIMFSSEVLDLNPMDFLTKFEQWACAQTKCMCHAFNTVRNIDQYHPLASGIQENLQSMRHDCTHLIVNGLRK